MNEPGPSTKSKNGINTWLETTTITNRHSSHADPFTVAPGQSWSINTVTMHHSSDGQPRRQRPIKLVVMGKR
jgi:hypothetical protein